MTPFFYAGFDTIPQQAEEAAEGLDWNKFGRVISLALLASGGFYMVCIYSFGSIIPWTDFVKSSVPALACLKTINIFFVYRNALHCHNRAYGSHEFFLWCYKPYYACYGT